MHNWYVGITDSMATLNWKQEMCKHISDYLNGINVELVYIDVFEFNLTILQVW
jgi:hypothetical protein